MNTKIQNQNDALFREFESYEISIIKVNLIIGGRPILGARQDGGNAYVDLLIDGEVICD